MAVVYSATAINARLTAVANTINAGLTNGSMKLLNASGTVLSTISLAYPCATVNGGVLTFNGTLLDPAAAATGITYEGRIFDSNGNQVVSGLTVGIPLSGADILLTNGLNSTVITAGQTVQVLSAQIQGS